MLAREIGQILSLPVIHLDRLYWEPGWVHSQPEIFRMRVTQAISGDRWVTDGNYAGRTGDIRLPRADAIIWLEPPRWLSMARVIRRMLRKSESERADLPVGCTEQINGDLPSFLAEIWAFNRRTRPRIEAQIEKYAATAQIIRLRNIPEISAFLASLDERRP